MQRAPLFTESSIQLQAPSNSRAPLRTQITSGTFGCPFSEGIGQEQALHFPTQKPIYAGPTAVAPV
jgi:hypothetical protein